MRMQRAVAAVLALIAGPALLAQQAGTSATPASPPQASGSASAPSGAAQQAATAPGAADPQSPGQGPTFRTGVELVNVDVGVHDRQGKPLTGLTPGDFTVTVAGQPRRVVSAEFVDVSTGPAAKVTPDDFAPISTNEGAGVGRLIAFIVDQSSLESGSVRQVASSAGRFLSKLTFADRSALVIAPVGKGVGFTWNHNTVRDGLQRAVGLASFADWQTVSLAEARDIATRNPAALRNVADRECRGSSLASAGLGNPSPGGSGSGGGSEPSTGSGQSGGGSGATGETPAGGTTGGGTSRGNNSRGGSGFGGFGNDSCMRELQLQAEMAWREAQMNSYASLTALRQALATLGRVRGDKTLVLISGGMPLDEREHSSILAAVADEAAAARATLYTIYVPSVTMSVTRRTVSASPMLDQQIHAWPLETLAGMTGGDYFRADVGADGAFERLGRQLAGYYRLGVEKAPIDVDGKSRRIKVQVPRNGYRVRAREIFDARTYEDRDWTARLADALMSPTPATALRVRVTSYLAGDPDAAGGMKLLLAGEASRLRPGKATFQVIVRNLEGAEVISGEQPLGEVTDDRIPFSTSIPVAQGSYIVRLAIMDSEGRVGSVDHRVEARRSAIGGLSASGPVLVRVPNRPELEPRVTLDSVQQDERLALQVDLEGAPDQLAGADVQFEIAATATGPALVSASGEFSESSGEKAKVAQGVADLRVLPAGQYVVRARVKSGSAVGEVRRGFTVTEAPRVVVAAEATSTAALSTPASVTTKVRTVPIAERAVEAAPRFAIDQVMAPQLLTGFLDRLAARPDTASPAARELLGRARSAAIDDLVVSESLAKEAPVAVPFLRGLALLKQGRLDAAVVAFQSALRAGGDFYPAMVYLGACYAARGQDKEAAGAWNTALIKERDTLAVHALLADALLRTGRHDLALQALDRARARWPDDGGLKRSYAVAAVAVGRYGDGLKAVDELVDKDADDEPVLALALLVLYEAFENDKPIDSLAEDRTRMNRLADAYRARGGPSLALVETWVATANKNNKK